MSTVNAKMIALANEIRELSGTTTPKSIDIMTSDVDVANTEIVEQTDLIMQIKSVVNNLPEVGSGEIDIILQNKTVTPTTSAQSVTADSGYNGLDTVIVNAIPNTYIKPIVMQSATTYMPTTTDQTIAAGTYCSDMQTIKGDSNLVSENIKSGVSIFGVAGSAESGGSSNGESLETVTITINFLAEPGAFIYYIDGSLTLQSRELFRGMTCSVLKNSILIMTDSMHDEIPSCINIVGNAYQAIG